MERKSKKRLLNNHKNLKANEKRQISPIRSRNTNKLVKKSDIYKCPFCPEAFEQRSEFDLHYTLYHEAIQLKKKRISQAKKAKNEEIFVINCQICQRQFEENEAYKIHMALFHKDDKQESSKDKHKCQVCDKTCLSKIGLKLHARTHQKQPKKDDITEEEFVANFTCEQCDEPFKYETSLNMHIRIIHEGSYDFTCDHCGHVFRQKSDLVSIFILPMVQTR